MALSRPPISNSPSRRTVDATARGPIAGLRRAGRAPDARCASPPRRCLGRSASRDATLWTYAGNPTIRPRSDRTCSGSVGEANDDPLGQRALNLRRRPFATPMSGGCCRAPTFCVTAPKKPPPWRRCRKPSRRRTRPRAEAERQSRRCRSSAPQLRAGRGNSTISPKAGRLGAASALLRSLQRASRSLPPRRDKRRPRCWTQTRGAHHRPRPLGPDTPKRAGVRQPRRRTTSPATRNCWALPAAAARRCVRRSNWRRACACSRNSADKSSASRRRREFGRGG